MATLLVDAPRSDPSLIQIGSMIAGRYECERVVGRGGFGAVFSARHTGTGQGVALKILASGDEDDDTAMRRFFQEARVTSGLRHPNTIRVFDFGQDDSGLVYIAMELLTGRTLKQELRARRKQGQVFEEREAIEIAVAITRSLGEAHAAGLVHRDLKPDNVFLHQVEGDDPVVKVLDFGIVKLRNSGITQVNTGGGPGTPAYMSPEQAQNRAELDGRSDLYSLGVIMWQLVVGKVPFRGEGDVQTLYMHAHEPLPNLYERARVPVSESYVHMVYRALAKDPEGRYPDARQMRTALRESLDITRDSLVRNATPVSRPELSADLALDVSENATIHTTPAIPTGGFMPAPEPLPADALSPVAPFDQPLPTDDRSDLTGSQIDEPRQGSSAIIWLAAVVFLVVGAVTFYFVSKGPEEIIPSPPVVIRPPAPPPAAAVVEPERTPVAEAPAAPVEAEAPVDAEPDVEVPEPTPTPTADVAPEPAPAPKRTKPRPRRRAPPPQPAQKSETDEILDLKI